MTSPAERYAASRRRAAQAKTEFGRFAQRRSFDLDEFQVKACEHLERGQAVLVAAPTGAGKTVVGEFAVHLALAQGKKAFYTTPIKALSNQKFHELRQTYGSEAVGLLTGDTAVNAEAPVVVMTTEVLRNMLYQDSSTLEDLGFVVMDEVHYLADRFRGAVWEEVIIHLPVSVQLAALSATVSNAEEFGAWLDTVRGDTAVVVSEHRPVPLWQHMMVNYRLHDLFVEDDSSPAQDTQFLLNPELQRVAQMAQAPASRRSGGHRSRGRGRHGPPVHSGRGKGSRGRSSDTRQPGGPRGTSHASAHRNGTSVSALSGSPVGQPRLNRARMLTALDRQGLLPCIDFIFSRAGCEAAVEQCMQHGIRLTTDDQAREIASRVERIGWELPAEDLSVLGFDQFREALINGVAAHHAGMLPPFKELVESLYAEGLLKVVFATETLALGINMPARTVVLEKLDKFNGESHQDISAGEYTQLTGRAGRRGIDVEGHAVVIWQPGMDPRQVAGLASRRTYPLNSSFSPSYNMAVNLTAQFGRRRARTILESSFAQYQADRAVVGLARDVASREASLKGYEEAMQCHLGDFAEYAALRRKLSAEQKNRAGERARQRRKELVRVLSSLEPGDVIEVEGKRRLGTSLVVHSAPAHDPRPGVVTEDGKLRNVTVEDFRQPPEVISYVKVPRKPQVKVPKVRRDLASSMRAALRERTPPRGNAPGTGFVYRDDSDDSTLDSTASGAYTEKADGGYDRYAAIEEQLRQHPCHGCRDREDHARWAQRWWQLQTETDALREKISRRTGSIAKTFDRICGVLSELGHLVPVAADQAIGPDLVGGESQGIEFSVTERGQRLRRIYGERDLFTEMLIHRGILDRLSAEELAAFATTLVYQAKRDDEGVMPHMPTAGLAHAVRTALDVHHELEALEKQHHVETTATPELGLAIPMYHWATGASLRAALEDSPLAAGDFVRWAKQCVDVLDQLSAVPTVTAKFAARCQDAVDRIARGVVSYSSVTYLVDDDEELDDLDEQY